MGYFNFYKKKGLIDLRKWW